MMTISWSELEALVVGGRVAGVVAALRDLDDAERRALAAPLREFERRLRAAPQESRPGGIAWWEVNSTLAVAGAGVFPRSELVALIRRTSWWEGPHATEPEPTPAGTQRRGLLQALADRRSTWLPELAHALAERLSVRQWDPRWLIVADLVALTGCEPPVSDGFVINWITVWRSELSVAVRRGPAWADLVHRGLLIDGVGSILGSPAVIAQVVELAAAGLLDRALMIDNCVARLQRGGRAGDLAGIRMVLDALSPTPEEVAARLPDYLAMLSGTPGTAAILALNALRALDAVEPLSLDEVLTAGRVVLSRSEKGLIRTQLSWLDAVAARPGTDVAEVLGVVTVAFAHSAAADLQARALRVVLNHADRLGPRDRAQLAEAAVELPSDLREKAVARLAAVPVHTTVTVPVPAAAATSIPPAGPSPALAELSSVAELAEDLSAHLAGPYDSGRDPVRFEQLAAALVRFAAVPGRAALAEGLAPLLAADPSLRRGAPDYTVRDTWKRLDPHRALSELIGAATGDPVPRPVGPLDEVLGWREWVAANGGQLSRPSLAIAVRVSELAVRLGHGRAVPLLAVPTSVDGLIDPDVFAARLAARAADGEPPWPHDLAQALLRLPPGPHPELAARVRTLGLPQTEAEAVARWLAEGGVREPVAELVDPPRPRADRPYWENFPLSDLRPGAPFVRLGGIGDGDDGAPALLPAAFAAVFSTGDLAASVWRAVVPLRTLWPSLLPTHREVVAAHAVPLLVRHLVGGRGASAVLPLLAESHGPIGPAMRVALAYGLSASHADDRAAAVDALVILAARRQLDGVALGATLADLLRSDGIVLTRIVPGLRDLGRAGALSDLWDVVAAALEGTLPVGGRPAPNRLGDLVGLAAETAAMIRPARSIPGLEVVAARSGSSRLVTEARRLHRLLAP